MRLDHIGRAFSWGEAQRLIDILKDDPSSAIAAALAGWPHPMSREALILADLFDVQHMSKAKKKPPPYPRPWATDGRTRTRKGNAAGRTREQVRELLRDVFGRTQD